MKRNAMFVRWVAVALASALLSGCYLYQLKHIDKEDKTEAQWSEVQKPAPAAQPAPPAKR